MLPGTPVFPQSFASSSSSLLRPSLLLAGTPVFPQSFVSSFFFVDAVFAASGGRT